MSIKQFNEEKKNFFECPKWYVRYLSAEEAMVLSILVDCESYAEKENWLKLNDTNFFQFNITRYASQIIGCSERTIKRILKQLEDKDYICKIVKNVNHFNSTYIALNADKINMLYYQYLKDIASPVP